MKRTVSDVKSELTNELKDLEMQGDDELKSRWRSLYGTVPPQKIHRSLLIAGGCPPNAGECIGCPQIFGPPPSNPGRRQPGDLPTLT